MNGSIQILNGKAIVKDATEGGQDAVLYAHPNLIIKINGKEEKESIKVKQKDQIEIIPINEEAQRIFEIRTTKDSMSAYGIVHYSLGREVTIQDSADQGELKIDVKTQEIQPKEYTYPEIVKQLGKAKIIHGVKKESINKLLANPGNEEMLAQGEKAQKGEDGYIDYLFYHKKEEKAEVDINEKIDYKNLNEIVSVEKKALIAKKIPAVKGINGKNIYGKIVRAPAPKDPALLAGKNVRIDEDGLRAYSVVDGKPALKGKVIHVYSVHEVFQDVDITTGNIGFHGNVIIRGDIKEGMSVKAGHDVTIYGSVSSGNIQAGGQVIIKQWAIKSNIIAGAQQTEIKSLHSDVSKLHGLLLQLYKASTEVLNKLTNAGAEKMHAGKLIRALLENHFGEIISLLKKLNLIDKAKLTTLMDDKFYKDVDYFIKRYSIYGVSYIKDIDEIKNDILRMSKMKEKLEGQFKDTRDITLSYAQNSTIKASGDIIVTGQGCLNSDLYAGGSVSMENKESFSRPAVFRGGKIQCNGDIKISEIGSTGGADTQVETSRKGKIIFKRLFFNTHIQIGESKKKIEENESSGMCYRNKKGDIVIYSASED